jgi:lipopolysaccharide export system protein LptA
MKSFKHVLIAALTPIAAITGGLAPVAIAQTAPPSNPQAMQLRANSTQANAKTGVLVAQGNVQINYVAKKIQATSAQAIYYSKEGRIVLSGNVYVLQDGNSLRGEQITYLVNEGRFEAVPQNGQQVEAVYLVQDTSPAPVPVAPSPTAAPAPTKVPFPKPQAPKPEVKPEVKPEASPSVKPSAKLPIKPTAAETPKKP